MNADNLDIAAEREEIARQDAARRRKPEGPQPTGRCHYCDEILDDNMRWCSADHRDLWEREHGRG